MQGFLLQLLLCSVTMSALALVYMALTPLLAKRYAVKGRYYAWLVIVIGLVIPFRPQWGAAAVTVALPRGAAVPVIQTGGAAPAAFPAAHVAPGAALPWWQWAAAAWLAGAVLFLAYHGVKHFRFLKLARRWSEDVTDEPVLALARQLKMQLGLTKHIGLQYCHCIGSPMLIGFARPCILLPAVGFAAGELSFILKHELIHYKRRDLWYKGLVLFANALHWFNPLVYWAAKAIGVQCELSCDAEVVRGAGMQTRQCYSETIIGVARLQSNRRTALSTHFYGGLKSLKERIYSLMDTSKKKTGLTVLCGILLLTLGAGASFAAKVEAPIPPQIIKESTVVAPQVPVSFLPDPAVYAPYAAFGLTLSGDGAKLLYNGQPVGLFVDEQADAWAFYLDETQTLHLTAVRNSGGQITGVERISPQRAQAYQELFFAEDGSAPSAQAPVDGLENSPFEATKYDQYQPFGITYSPAEGALLCNGQRVKLFADQLAGGLFETLWIDEAGAVNLETVRNEAGQIIRIEPISDEKARAYRSASEEYAEKSLDGLEQKVADRVQARYPAD